MNKIIEGIKTALIWIGMICYFCAALICWNKEIYFAFALLVIPAVLFAAFVIITIEVDSKRHERRRKLHESLRD